MFGAVLHFRRIAETQREFIDSYALLSKLEPQNPLLKLVVVTQNSYQLTPELTERYGAKGFTEQDMIMGSGNGLERYLQDIKLEINRLQSPKP